MSNLRNESSVSDSFLFPVARSIKSKFKRFHAVSSDSCRISFFSPNKPPFRCGNYGETEFSVEYKRYSKQTILFPRRSSGDESASFSRPKSDGVACTSKATSNRTEDYPQKRSFHFFFLDSIVQSFR
ncbi:hypothetical protein K0M31_019309 [Melipona bicolor]|uniref:Uncharacterized protein n=1 Tax=Melipona bicolor TaxID=60889 RepID=A0AA40G2I1_9HYME|nr:hypothetical protein K0M31_019309 [Melipona bicolor]